MKTSVLYSKKLLALVLTVAIASSATAVALNWHKVAEVMGIVKKSPVTIKEVASIDLGELETASEFCGYSYAEIFVEEDNEVEITELVIAIPEPVEETLELFSELNLNIIIGKIKVEDIPIVPFPGAPVWKWVDYDEIEGTYYHFFSCGSWSTVSLEEGTHKIKFQVYGTTGSPPEDTAFNLKFYIEIQEGKD